MIDLDARAALILEVASRRGVLVAVSDEDAESWRAAWRDLQVAVLAPIGVRAPRPAALRLKRPPRAVPPPASLLDPGTWVWFRPHHSTPEPGHVLQVVALVPPGQSLADALTPEQLGLLDPHASVAPCTRYARVVVGVPGGRRVLASLRCVLAGAFARRATRIPPADLPSALAVRLPDPLPPGSAVSWEWHSSLGPARLRGIVTAFVPALSRLLPLLPADALHDRPLQDVSLQDRYLVRLEGSRHYRSPAAHLVERAAVGEVS